MNPNYDDLAEILAAAEELTGPARLQYLDANCPPEFRTEVESLLRAGDRGRDTFDCKTSALNEILVAFRGEQLAGQTVGPYLLGELLGAGGMGVVYRAHHLQTGAAVALKVIPAQLGDLAWQIRFQREAAALRTIDHPGVVRLIESGEDDTYRYLAMELLEGETLRTSPPGDWRNSVATMLDVASALAVVHSHGIIHRDLKPENIVIEPSGRPVLIDFGLARKDPNPENSVAGISGTVSYFSPEQVRGEPATDRSDIFAFGTILYERLAARRAFNAPSSLATAAAILNTSPPRLPRQIPVALNHLVRRCLEKDPSKRPTVTEITLELSRLSRTSRLETLGQQRWTRTAIAAAAVFMLAATALFTWRSVTPGPFYRQPISTQGIQVFEPALAWNGGLLAFTSPGPSGARDAWLTPPDSWQPTRATFDASGVNDPALSPNGGQLAFVSHRNPAGIYVRDLATNHERLLAGDGLAPRYSPDGRWIAYWTGRDTPADAFRMLQPKVFLIPALGGQPILVGNGRHPVWSPDSSRIAFDSDGRLYLWDLKAQKATSMPNQARMALAWRTSLARDEIIFLDKTSRLMSLHLPGSVPTPLTEGQSEVTRLTADRTGRILLAEESTTVGLWSLALGQSGARLVALHKGREGYLFPRIAADGKTLTYQTGAKTEALNLVSGKLEPLPQDSLLTARGGTLRSVSHQGIVWDASENGGLLAHCESPAKRSCIVRLGPKGKQVKFTHPRLHLYLASFSPSSTQIVFTGEADDAPAHMFIAPAAGAPPEQWQDLGPGDYPRWSPDGRIFYLSEGLSGRPTLFVLNPGHPPRELHPFNASSPSPRLLKPGAFRIAAAYDRLVMPLGERDGRFYRAENISWQLVSPFSSVSPVYRTGGYFLSKIKLIKTTSLSLLSIIGLTAPAAATPIALQNATATFTQSTGLPTGPVSPGAMINGSFAGDEGWAIFDPSGNAFTSAQTAVFETVTNQGLAGGSLLNFTISQLYTFQGSPSIQHTLGRFRISVTTDDRSTFADGLATGGDVTANWTVLTPSLATGTGSPTMTVQGDGSILVSGTNPDNSVYTITALTSLQGITGIRLEALEDPSLPTNGPGRKPSNGNFVITEFQADISAPSTTPEPGTMATMSLGLALGLGCLRMRKG